MGPSLLFDKSFLQSLSLDESVWFDNFFNSVICPIFILETLADLKKPIKTRTSADEVRIIADKTPEFNGVPTVSHIALLEADLMEFQEIMDSKPILLNAKKYKVGEKKRDIDMNILKRFRH